MDEFDLGVLATLDALLQEGSVTGAARRVGLSTPAMSHALARIRERLDDPLLVRAGRGMVLTPRAEALKPRVHTLVNEARQALARKQPFAARDLERSFAVHATDYVLAVLGGVVDRILREEAPRVALRFVPNTTEDPAALRSGATDLAVGIYGDLPEEIRSRTLLTDSFVCVVREGHPTVKHRLSLQQFAALSHVQIAPRGKPGGYLDDALRAKGFTRHVARAVPYFVAALQLVAETDYVLTLSERLASKLGPGLRLRVLAPPLPLRPYALSIVWHPRFDGDQAHRFLREVFLRAAGEAAADRHEAPRTRLEAPRRPARLAAGGRRPRPT